MKAKKLRVGVVGIGKISGIYLKNLTTMFADAVEVSAVGDILGERAEAAAAEYGIPRVLSPNDLIASPDVDLVLNLTIPKSHFEVSMRAVRAGKHVYAEKPLCIAREEAASLRDAAAAAGVRIGGAPDTFLGAGIQTCRKLIDDGWIGAPLAASASMMCRGHEHWHPAPEFYYKTGGGPMFDMGPYYLTALVCLLGPATRISGTAKTGFPTRTISSEPQRGRVIDVDVPTHIAGVVDFACGATATITTSFDVWSHTLPFIEIYGSEGTLRVPDPNTFGGPVLLKRGRAEAWSEIPLIKDYPENSRGLGVADLARSLAAGKPHRASGELCSHVLDLMHGFHDASASGTYYQVKSACSRPEALQLAAL